MTIFIIIVIMIATILMIIFTAPQLLTAFLISDHRADGDHDHDWWYDDDDDDDNHDYDDDDDDDDDENDFVDAELQPQGRVQPSDAISPTYTQWEDDSRVIMMMIMVMIMMIVTM